MPPPTADLYTVHCQLFIGCLRLTCAISSCRQRSSQVRSTQCRRSCCASSSFVNILLPYVTCNLLGSGGPPLRLGDETITASDHVRLLGVTISSDLSHVKHVGTISSSHFYWLRQIRRIRRSLDAESAKTLVHAFITSRVDGCNTVLAGSPRTITDRLQCLLSPCRQ